MKTIYLSEEASLSGGGPNIFCHKFATEMNNRGNRVIYSNPQKADVALCIINTNKVIGKIDKSKTKVILRIGGINNRYYNKYNEEQLKELYCELRKNFSYADKVIFLSNWSRNTIFEEIGKESEDNKYFTIHNGVDLNIFKPSPKQDDGIINLLHVGNMRKGYFMEALVGAYNELINRKFKVRLNIVGSMDSECKNVLNNCNNKEGIRIIGSFPNDKLTQAYGQGDIFLAVRVGGTGDNAVVEAQSCGLPVVCASYSGNAELIINERTGIVAESGKCEYGMNYNKNIADAVEKIIPDLEIFKKRSRDNALERFSVKKMADEYLEAING